MGFRAIQQAASWALDGIPLDLPFFEFATAFLKMYRDKVVRLKELPYADQFSDWVEAGRHYLEDTHYRGFKGVSSG